MESKPSVGERIIRLVPEVRSRREVPAETAEPIPEVIDLADPPLAVLPDLIDLADRRQDPTSDVIILPVPFPVPVSEDGCGPGNWCEACREEIRQEALAWIRDLNATTDHWATAIPVVRRITGDLWSLPSDGGS